MLLEYVSMTDILTLHNCMQEAASLHEFEILSRYKYKHNLIYVLCLEKYATFVTCQNETRFAAVIDETLEYIVSTLMYQFEN